MPCYDGPRYDNDPALQRRADLNARVACEALTALAKVAPDTRLSSEARDWWIMHQIHDKERKEREVQQRREKAERDAAREIALKKLSPKDRKALGLG